MEWTAVLVCVGVFLVFNAVAVCVFSAECVVMDEAENEFDEYGRTTDGDREHVRATQEGQQ